MPAGYGLELSRKAFLGGSARLGLDPEGRIFQGHHKPGEPSGKVKDGTRKFQDCLEETASQTEAPRDLDGAYLLDIITTPRVPII